MLIRKKCRHIQYLIYSYFIVLPFYRYIGTIWRRMVVKQQQNDPITSGHSPLILDLVETSTQLNFLLTMQFRIRPQQKANKQVPYLPTWPLIQTIEGGIQQLREHPQLIQGLLIIIIIQLYFTKKHLRKETSLKK